MRLFSSYRPTEVQSLRSLNITQGSSGSVGKRSKASGLVPERDEESSRGQRPRKPVELPTLKGSHPAEPGFNLCDLVRRVRPRVGTQTFAFRGALPPATNFMPFRPCSHSPSPAPTVLHSPKVFPTGLCASTCPLSGSAVRGQSHKDSTTLGCFAWRL